MHLRKASFSSHGSSHSPSSSHHSIPLSASGLHVSRPSLSVSMPSLSPSYERSVASLEKEIMRLQEVLKEREAEISMLEESLKESQTKPVNGTAIVEAETNGVNGASSVHPEAALSPKTLHQFDNIRKTMENGINGHSTQTETGSSLSEDESLDRLNELMLYVCLFNIGPLSHGLNLVPWLRKSPSTGKS